MFVVYGHYCQVTSHFQPSKKFAKNERMCYDVDMTELLESAIVICSCRESTAGTVIVLHRAIEHHCAPPNVCWTDVPLANLDDL